MSKEFYPVQNGDLDRNEICSQSGVSSVKQREDISYFTEKGIFSPGGLVDTLSSPAPTMGQSSSPVQQEVPNVSNPSESTSRRKLQARKVSGLPDSAEPDMCASDKALVIDHILEKIFSYSDIASLKNFRLVSHRWRLFGAKELQKSVKIEFYKYDESNFVLRKVQADTVDKTADKHSRTNSVSKNSTEQMLDDLAEYTLDHLILLMQSSSVFPYFPCKCFTFNARHLNDPSFQNFINIHGFHIKTLRLNLRYGTMKECAADIPALQKILVDQVPNMECFELQVRMHDGWEREDQVKFSSLPQHCTEIEQWRSVAERRRNLNFKLKSMEFYLELPRTIFESIVRLAPNLKQVALDSRYLDYLTEPTNRVHLLKKIMVFIWDGNLEIWEKIVHHYEYLQLKDICFYLNSIYNNHPDILSRAAAVINKLLESSCSSLEKVLWAPMSCLPGIKIPRMPKVKELLFGDYYWKAAEPQHFFPEGTSLPLIFPNLQTVCFAFGFLADSDMNALHTCFNNLDPVPSVRNVYIKDVEKLSTAFAEQLYKWFPNARFM